MDLGGVNVTAANDATVRGIENERSIDSVEVAEWEELWPGAWEVSCCMLQPLGGGGRGA